MSSENYIIIVAGEPNSIFLEIFFKSLKKINTKKHIILIASLKLVKLQMSKLKYKKKIKILKDHNILDFKINNNVINLINVDYNPTKAFENISSKSNDYILKCFKNAFKIIKKYKITKFINGPINKKTFLDKKYEGITEYISKSFKIKKNAMLIYNEKLSVCPITTHLPIKAVSKNISKKTIVEKILLIHNFYKKLNKKAKIAIIGLNPHCETIDKFNEDEEILKPAVKNLKKKGLNIAGPFAADTIFLKKNRSKYNVIVGMYHDQVLTPIKTIFEYDAINITLGLPFLRVSPDHGPNEKMLGKNMSNPLSLIKAIQFLDRN
ncbi:4-hydroxythreonine-4-phosphate dehydrogenase PdxA [Pelagibacterales bacterium SAG-MED22]|nr:4-hydroxythreonine-4-phosphate dehydrogenase PdxA [Pelagibacterales bacterium SAG-MED22]